MKATLDIRNESARKRLYRRDDLRRLVERVCAGEGLETDVDLSALLCDDAFMCSLNRTYRNKNRPTDVLAFPQDPVDGNRPVYLGDIVISLETIEQQCKGDPAAMRNQVRLLVCHGLLHLLGYDHTTARDRKRMATKQAEYTGLDPDAAWIGRPDQRHSSRRSPEE